MIALTIGLAVFVGIALGLLGGGGSILTVPLLAYVAGMDAKQAIATSLLVVGATSAIGAISHARAGRVQWRTGLIFGAAGMAGAYAGGILARYIPGTVLLIGFAVMMIATAIAMLRGRRNAETSEGEHRLPIPKIIAEGLVVGLVTGLVGAGGGFLVVPALALLGGLPMPLAVGTSLIVIAMKSFAGLAGYLTSVHINWTLALAVTTAAVLGALIGSRLTALINPDALRKTFGWFVLAMSSVILAQEIHPAVGITAAALTATAAGLHLACTRKNICPLRRLTPGRREPAATGQPATHTTS
ncbi:putative membrane transporter protein [Mycolicibacterium vanbaalenii]|uniref:Probable membrane transporter protein n=1 Tax=Mycolicibacterium vanbaalenii TaxID=110539 RepID=A0A5S9RBA1_MYCVN|nr:sulfite exporter TauE/SafE family protein [Mycolicibacterium vanbaalenii]CAA0134937.1 putative membrane transporter protein [Mycolicibacterium vanbaalenii]